MYERWLKIFFRFLIFTGVLVVLLIGCLTSCKIKKEVIREVTKYDSVAIKENEDLKMVLSEEKERYEKEREQWESTGVIFETTPCPDSNKVAPAKIIFADNGRIKSIEGNVKSLTSDLYEKSAELYDAHKTIDSLQYELEHQEVKVKIETKTVNKTVKTKVYPIWMWFLVLAGMFIEYKFKIANKIISLIKLKLWQRT